MPHRMYVRPVIAIALIALIAAACQTGDKSGSDSTPRSTPTSAAQATPVPTIDDERDVENADVDPPCDDPRCLEAQTRITGAPACAEPGSRVCLALLGQVSPALVEGLVQFYQAECGLTVSVLTPLSIGDDLFSQDRLQVDAIPALEFVGSSFPSDYNDPDATIIVLSAVDIYDSTTDYRFVFGIKGTASDPKGIISTFRMDPRVFGEDEDAVLFHTRVRKFVSKYIGLLHFDLPLSAERGDPMYDPIFSLDDLDAMTEPLPVCR